MKAHSAIPGIESILADDFSEKEQQALIDIVCSRMPFMTETLANSLEFNLSEFKEVNISTLMNCKMTATIDKGEHCRYSRGERVFWSCTFRDDDRNAWVLGFLEF